MCAALPQWPSPALRRVPPLLSHGRPRAYLCSVRICHRRRSHDLKVRLTGRVSLELLAWRPRATLRGRPRAKLLERFLRGSVVQFLAPASAAGARRPAPPDRRDACVASERLNVAGCAGCAGNGFAAVCARTCMHVRTADASHRVVTAATSQRDPAVPGARCWECQDWSAGFDPAVPAGHCEWTHAERPGVGWAGCADASAVGRGPWAVGTPDAPQHARRAPRVAWWPLAGGRWVLGAASARRPSNQRTAGMPRSPHAKPDPPPPRLRYGAMAGRIQHRVGLAPACFLHASWAFSVACAHLPSVNAGLGSIGIDPGVQVQVCWSIGDGCAAERSARPCMLCPTDTHYVRPVLGHSNVEPIHVASASARVGFRTHLDCSSI